MKRAIEFLVLFSLCLLAGAIVGTLARADVVGEAPPAGLPAPSLPPTGFFPGGYADHAVRVPLPPMVQLCHDGAALIAGMAGFVQVKLAIAPEQRPAWERFVERAVASVQPLQARCPGGTLPPPPADFPAMLERRQAMLAAALDATTTFNAALAELLPALSADQRARLTALAMPPAMAFR